MALQGLEGFKLVLPDSGSTTFRAKRGINCTTEQDWSFLFNGGANALALFERLARSGRADEGLKQSAYLGTGAGQRVFLIEFAQFEGSTETWGGYSGADMQRLRDVLDQKLATVTIDSNNPATLHHGEWSSAGLYSPVSVVPLSTQLTVNYTEESSTMTGQLRLADAADIGETNTAEGRTG